MHLYREMRTEKLAKMPPSSSSSAPLITILVLLSFFSTQVACSQATTLFSPIKKDANSNLYTMLLYLKTPLQPSQLHLDLGFYLPWYDCARHYNSSTYHPVLFNSSLCTELQTNFGGGCMGKSGPGCSNDTCAYFPENPVTGKGGMGLILTDKFTLPTAKNPSEFGPASQIVLSCTFPDKFSKNYRGLARGSTGLATLGRYNYSLSAQISRGSSAPWIFALCLPSSSNASGIALFNSAGPYNFSPNIDASELLTYTPLILGPRGSDTKILYWYKSPDYYIGLTSFRVNDKVVLLNQTLLAIDENGLGGQNLESDALNLTRVNPVAPFSVCYAADKIRSTRVGPAVPAIGIQLITSATTDQLRQFRLQTQLKLPSKTTIEEDVLENIRETNTPKEAWDMFAKLFSKKNDTKLQLIESSYGEARMKRIIIHGLKPEFRTFVATVQGCPAQPSLVEFENLLAGQEVLAKQMGGVSLKNDEETLYANKGRRNSKAENPKRVTTRL
ncbi:UNVERIFIED_CONTAM: putative aspartic proteinase GIP2 [Sesamum calycinum]|uniref:Aspartic proteinase GIP2 n=1 Tax=Sesamum calycinum TaxID=2727403 RepID=A0AAW2SH91_9LAMI